MNNHKSHSAFTLLEILTVTAIFAMLAAVLVPIVGKAMDSARKSTVSNNLRQIALAYYSFLNSDDRQKANSKTSLHDFIAVLAENTDLNDPHLWIIKEDPLVEQSSTTFPTHVAFPNNQLDNWELNKTFRDSPISITLVKGISVSANLSTTPVAWTRGLRPDGKWAPLTDPHPGVYGQKGGFIAFLDGHVKWYTNLNENGGLLTHYTTRKPTSNILDAIPPHASVLD